MSKIELRLTGSGGQGVILASVILAEAAVQAGKYTAQSQSYGPEARGGSCKAETIISDEPIGFTKVQQPDFLMALTQDSLNKYTRNLPENCVIMIDDELEVPEGISDARVVRLPILRTAREKVGRQQTANIVAVACINEIMGIVDDDTLRKAVIMHIPAGTEAVNRKAMEEGIALVPADKRAGASHGDKGRAAHGGKSATETVKDGCKSDIKAADSVSASDGEKKASDEKHAADHEKSHKGAREDRKGASR